MIVGFEATIVSEEEEEDIAPPDIDGKELHIDEMARL